MAVARITGAVMRMASLLSFWEPSLDQT